MSLKDLSHVELKHLQEFMTADVDGSGFISESQLRQSLEKFGLKSGRTYTDQEIKDRMKLFDLNKDGYISKDEFLYKMKHKQETK